MAELPKPISHTAEAIFRHYERNAWSGESDGIPVSAAENDCDRAVWYAFRWAHPPTAYDGRMLRLFRTGDRDEARMIEELRAIGCVVEGEQEKIRGLEDHLRGKIDGRVIGIPEAPQTEHLLECKSHNARNFKTLLKDGVRKAKPAHFAQCQLGMHLTGLRRALYIASCKDDDALHVERLEHDATFCLTLLARLERIVRSDTAPAKLHQDPEAKGAFHCLFCPAKAICHDGEWPRVNCRTCLHSSPVSGGRWRCTRFDKELSRNDQRAACPAHLYLPSIVPGEQVDADPARETVTYRLRDGSLWTDGQERAT